MYFFKIFQVTESKESFLCIDSQPGQTPTYMVSSDVLSCFKRRLSRFAASHLESLDFAADSPAHICKGVDYGDAAAIEACLREEGLSEMGEMSCAGCLESKC